jgi:hypothetical protein
MKVNLIAIILLTCFCWHCAYAQEIKDGFIILPDGKYQYGDIRFDPELNPYEACFFTPSSLKEFTKYAPDKILGYGVIDGVHYATKEIEVGSARAKYFLKVEIDGLVNVYSFKDNRFFADAEGFIELKNESGSGNYRKVLSELLKSCTSVLTI